ncbi:MAG: tetraacyldisaccharide 4-kinase [Rhodoferax sp.]|nr:tetraacyldisaccharide 4-kinase [Rhodoferax sp.]
MACLLWPVSLVFGLLGGLRRALFRAGLLASHKAGVPVVVIGNVIAGGSGKTPVVMALARHLGARGFRVGVVSRGYGRVIADGAADCREVLPDSAASDVGDEPLLVRRACDVPVFVARRRSEAAQALLARHPATQIILCDDGLQHYALQRDVEICVFDDRGVGNGWLLPAGPLREPWPRKVDLVLHTGMAPAFPGYRATRALAHHAVRRDGRRVALAELRGKPLLAVAAIAQPKVFFAMLRAQGLQVAQIQPRPDHDDFAHWTPPADHALTVVCTEKDAVKLWRFWPEALAVPLALSFDAGFLVALDERVDRALAASVSSAPGLAR